MKHALKTHLVQLALESDLTKKLKTDWKENVFQQFSTSNRRLHVAASIAFSIRHKFEPDFPCLSHSLCLLCFDVPLFSVVLARLALY